MSAETRIAETYVMFRKRHRHERFDAVAPDEVAGSIQREERTPARLFSWSSRKDLGFRGQRKYVESRGGFPQPFSLGNRRCDGLFFCGKRACIGMLAPCCVQIDRVRIFAKGLWKGTEKYFRTDPGRISSGNDNELARAYAVLARVPKRRSSVRLSRPYSDSM